MTNHFYEPPVLVRVHQVACVTSVDDLPAPLRRTFTHDIAVPAPDAFQRQQLLASFLGDTVELLPETALEELAAQTAGESRVLSRGTIPCYY